MKIDQLIDRKQAIRTLPKPTAKIRQRIGQAADMLNQKSDAQSRVEVLNEGLCNAVAMLYQRDADNGYSWLDRVTYRILCPMPWGSVGWRAWGLRNWEAGILSKILQERATRRAPLFDYNVYSRTWHLSVSDYRSQSMAMHYLAQQPISLAEWHRARSQERSKANGKAQDKPHHSAG